MVRYVIYVRVSPSPRLLILELSVLRVLARTLLSLCPATAASSCIKTPVGDALEIPSSTFLEQLLPPLPSGVDVDAFARRIRRSKRLSAPVLTKSGHLWGYSKRSPSEMEPSRAFWYLRLCIQRVSRKLRKPLTCIFEHNGDFSGSGSDDSFPDAYLRLARSEDNSALAWSSVVVSGEYQRMASVQVSKNVRSFWLSIELPVLII